MNFDEPEGVCVCGKAFDPHVGYDGVRTNAPRRSCSTPCRRERNRRLARNAEYRRLVAAQEKAGQMRLKVEVDLV